MFSNVLLPFTRGVAAQPVLSPGQKRLWFLHQLESDKALYNIPLVLHCNGDLDVGALKRTITCIVQRHEVLRTGIDLKDGEPITFLDTTEEFGLDIRNLGPDGLLQADGLNTLIQKEINRPFDLSKPPLLRAVLYRLSPKDHVLVVTMHHIVADGWSLEIFEEELVTLYGGFLQANEALLPPLSIRYTDYAAWQHDRLNTGVLAEQFSYWKTQLAGIAPTMSLPRAKQYHAIQGRHGTLHRFAIDKSIGKQMLQLCHKNGATLFMAFLGVFKVLLHRYTDETDIVVGTSIAGRSRSELEQLIGFFVNTLVFRTDLSGDPSFLELLGRVKKVAIEAYNHQEVPFEKLVAELQPQRHLEMSPLFQVMFSFSVDQARPQRIDGLTITREDVLFNHEKFDLTAAIVQRADTYEGVFSYRTTLFEKETIERMATHFQVLLEEIASDPARPIGRLNMLSEQEASRVVHEWNDTTTGWAPPQCVHRLFEEQVKTSPDAIAVLDADHYLTFEELNRRANQLARVLQRHGVGPEIVVALRLKSGIETPIAILAVLKAGGAYMPVDLNRPEIWIDTLLGHVRPALIMVNDEYPTTQPSHNIPIVYVDGSKYEFEDARAIPSAVISGNAAYVICTSGSTGRSKAIVVSHGALSNHMLWMQSRYGMNPADRVLQRTSLSFDASVWEVFWPLLNGGCLVVCGASVSRDPELLAGQIEHHSITFIQGVPTLLEMLSRASNLPGCRTLKRVFSGGELLSADLAKKLHGLLRTPISNLYGPTEATIDATAFDWDGEGLLSGPVSIGRPIANSQAYVLDSRLRPIPIGSRGELYIAGAGLARGYLGQAGLTAERFVANPFGAAGSRMYRTGDIVRWRVDGTLEFQERVDDQIKVHGFRIELGEIQRVLLAHPNVREAILVATGASHERKIVALITSASSTPVDHAGLVEFLSDRLPRYMLPARFVVLDEFPLLPSGKIDKNALTRIAAESTSSLAAEPCPVADVVLEHGDATDLYLGLLWKEVLGVERVDTTDDFFDLGGTSFTALIVCDRLSALYQRKIPVSTLFQRPTIAQMGVFLRQSVVLAPPTSIVPIQPKGSGTPLFCVHPAGGWVNGYIPLSRYLGQEYPLYGIQAYGLETDEIHLPSLELIASQYVRDLRKLRPHGPYQLAGHCLGGTIAYEMARQLVSVGEQVSLLALFDETSYSGDHAPAWTHDQLQEAINKRLYRVLVFKENLPNMEVQRLTLEERLALVLARYKKSRRVPHDLSEEQYRRYLQVRMTNVEARSRYQMQPYSGDMVLFRSTRLEMEDDSYGWRKLVAGEIAIYKLDIDHNCILVDKDSAEYIASRLREHIASKSGEKVFSSKL